MNVRGRYSQHARRAMMQARQCAQNEHHNVVDTSHLLVGILQLEGCLGRRILLELGMDPETAARQIATLHHADSPSVNSSRPLSGDLRTTLTFAAEESSILGHRYVGTEHLLLGLSRGNGGTARHLLHAASINLDHLRRQIKRILQEGETEIGLERAVRMARLSELSHRVLSRAALIAEEWQHPTVSLMHLILALSQEKRSPAGRLLAACGLDANRMVADFPYRATQADGSLLEEILDEAVLFAERMGSHYTGTDHIILVLTSNHNGARILTRYGVDLPMLTRRIEHLIRQSF